MRLGLVMDPIERIHAHKDTTLVLALAAQQRDWQLYYIPVASLELRQGSPFAMVASLQVRDNQHDYYSLGELRPTRLDSDAFDCVLMRQDPPVDTQYTYNLMILQFAEAMGVRVMNNPGELLRRNEKLGIAEFPDLAPPCLVSSNAESLRAFAAEQGEIVCKPLDGMGGTGVFHLKPNDDNLGTVIEMLSHDGRRMLMAQRFVPQIHLGDKRIFLFDGKPWRYCLARLPKPGEARANLAAGGRGETRELDERDWEIAAKVGEKLCGRGLYFVGLDVIGEWLTEINITSPTGAREIWRDTGSNPMEALLDVLEQAC